MNTTIISAAKLNLYLKVLAQRADGYHDLETLMVKIDLVDHLSFYPNKGSDSLIGNVINNTWQVLPKDFKSKNNLILKAIKSFKQAADIKECFTVDINKNIPLGAGLGGGSSNAGATLVHLNNIYQNPLSEDELIEIASEIGSDVPFFVWPYKAAVLRGRGDYLESIIENVSNEKFILINPKIFISTKEIFENLGLTNKVNSTNIPTLAAQFGKRDISNVSFAYDLKDKSNWGRNDLLKTVLKLKPKLAEIVTFIENIKQSYWGLSGSGSTFWIQSEMNTAQLISEIENKYPSFFITSVKVIKKLL